SPVRLGDWEIGIPMLMINTIGAGGGTIARFDSASILQVGPDSAGADPGPVCYGRGGAEVTVTDANIVLGYLHPEYLLGGKVQVDRQRAVDALETLGRKAGLNALQMAEGVIQIINTKMEEGIRQVSTERGYDVRDFALVAFGGAGPLHAAALGADLGIARVIVPPAPGVSSALGLVMVDLKRDYMTSRIRPLATMDISELNTVLDGLKQQALAEFQADGFGATELGVDYFLDLRYQGQGYELTIPLAQSEAVTASALQSMRQRFDELHEQLYGHSAATQPVEAVNYRGRITVTVPKFALEAEPVGANRDPTTALSERRQVCFSAATGFESCPVYDRARLQPGHQVRGGAIIEQFDSTTVILPGQTAEVDGYRNLVITTA
ncbi:MAG: hydantoinase/oxoprolinase family protein, partial [Chloroflexota bacterium]